MLLPLRVFLKNSNVSTNEYANLLNLWLSGLSNNDGDGYEKAILKVKSRIFWPSFFAFPFFFCLFDRALVW